MDSLYSIHIGRKQAHVLLTDNGFNCDLMAFNKIVSDTSKFLRLDQTSKDLIEHLVTVILLRKAREYFPQEKPLTEEVKE